MPPGKRDRQPPPALDQPGLEAAALRYVERFQTTRARLERLLAQKIRARGWADGAAEPDITGVADRLVALGYVNDAAFAEARARGLHGRGFGAGRVGATLRAQGVGTADREAAMAALDDVAAAIAFARRKRLGPFGPTVDDPKQRQRQFAAMMRAGHPPRLAQAILRASDETALARLAAEAGD